MKKIVAHPRIEDMATAINELIDGGCGAVGLLTLTPGATSTVVENPLIRLDSVPVLVATTANAAAALATTYISAINRGSFTLAHANTATTDRTYRFSLSGG